MNDIQYCTTVQKFRVSIHQGLIQLIKSDSQDIYNI